jgi:hypothetical protein
MVEACEPSNKSRAVLDVGEHWTGKRLSVSSFSLRAVQNSNTDLSFLLVDYLTFISYSVFANDMHLFRAFPQL